VKNWTGARNAEQLGPRCMQHTFTRRRLLVPQQWYEWWFQLVIQQTA
jgi:hypothetical protein